MQYHWNIHNKAPDSFYTEFPELPKAVADLLYNRQRTTQALIDEFLSPDYSTHIHDPFLFVDMEKAVARLLLAIEKQEKITIHGDYDADGVSASTVLTDTLRALGATQVDVYLPHRETDGYGLNLKTIDYLAAQKTQVIITCDCGISNTGEVAKANEYGIDVIITDHHSIPAVLPEAYAIIHPKLERERYPDKNLAGGGVAFKLAQALLKTHAKTHETLPTGEKHDTFEKWLLDMVAIATVADMVPLIGESRTLTKYGLLVLNKTRRIGLQKLYLETKLMHNDGSMDKEIDEQTIGFRIAPQINAAGRLDHANTAYMLMVADNGAAAIDLAYKLRLQNDERRDLTEQYVKDAILQVEQHQTNSPILFVLSEKWTTGIVGLIASRIKEKYQKPTIAMAYKKGELTGSGRSIKGFNMIGAMQEIPEFFSKFGGHPMACGFSLQKNDLLSAFQEALIARYHHHTADKDMSPTLDIDAELSLGDIDWKLFDVLNKFKPFGPENPRPRYVIKGLTVHAIESMGKEKNHMKLMVTDASRSIKKTVGWDLCNTDPETPNWCTLLKPGDSIDIVCEIDVNEWNGNRELQLLIIDLIRH